MLAMNRRISGCGLISSDSLPVLPSCCFVSGIPTKTSVRSVLYMCCMPRPSLLTLYAEQYSSVLSALCSLLQRLAVMSGYVPKYLGGRHDMNHGGGCCFCFYHRIPPSSAPPPPAFSLLSTWCGEEATVVGGTHYEVLR